MTVKHEGCHHVLTEIIKQSNKELKSFSVDFEEDLAIIQYTGGTTGAPKGLCLLIRTLFLMHQ